MLRPDLDGPDWLGLTIHLGLMGGVVFLVTTEIFHLSQSILGAFFAGHLAIAAAALGIPGFLVGSATRPRLQVVALEIRSSGSKGVLIGFLVSTAVVAAVAGISADPAGASWLGSRLAVIGMVSSLSVATFGVAHIVRELDFDSVLARLMKWAERRGPLHRDGQVVEATVFRRLTRLAQAAEHEDEHMKVLQRFGDTVGRTMSSPDYRGDGLEVAIDALVEAIKGNPLLTSKSDFVRGLHSIEDVKGRIINSGVNGPDLRRIQEALWSVASFVVEIASQNPRGQYEQAVESAIWALDEEPSAQFALLHRTLEIGQPLTRMKMAVRLCSNYLDETRAGRRTERCSRLLGFAGMLRQMGLAERRWVDEQIVGGMDIELQLALDEAHETMFTTGEFAAANALDLWRSELLDRRGRDCAAASAPLVSVNFSLFGKP